MWSSYVSTVGGIMGVLSIVAQLPHVSANPVPEVLQKRNGPGLHLVNCYVQGGGNVSEMDYYADDSQANGSGTSPTDRAIITLNGFQKWEGQAVTGTFTDTGVKFTSYINANGASQSTGTKVGTGYNGSNWNCYKDNNHYIWGNGGETCYSVYYCLQA